MRLSVIIKVPQAKFQCCLWYFISGYITMITAIITEVKFGENLSLEGLMSESGEYYVGVPQLSSCFQFDKNQASRDIKSLLDKSFQFAKLKTSLNPKGINAVPLEVFGNLIAELAFKGNQKAQIMTRILVNQSLYQLFCDAFGVKHEAEERQRWLTARFNTRHDFRPLTNQLQQYGFKEPWEYARFVSFMQAKIGLENGQRDFTDFETLNKLERCQTRLTTYMECGIDPWDALKKI